MLSHLVEYGVKWVAWFIFLVLKEKSILVTSGRHRVSKVVTKYNSVGVFIVLQLR